MVLFGFLVCFVFFFLLFLVPFCFFGVVSHIYIYGRARVEAMVCTGSNYIYSVYTARLLCGMTCPAY